MTLVILSFCKQTVIPYESLLVIGNYIYNNYMYIICFFLFTFVSPKFHRAGAIIYRYSVGGKENFSFLISLSFGCKCSCVPSVNMSPSWITVALHMTDIVRWLHRQYSLLPCVTFLQYEKPWLSTSSIYKLCWEALSITSKVTPHKTVGRFIHLCAAVRVVTRHKSNPMPTFQLFLQQSGSSQCTSSTGNEVQGLASFIDRLLCVVCYTLLCWLPVTRKQAGWRLTGHQQNDVIWFTGSEWRRRPNDCHSTGPKRSLKCRLKYIDGVRDFLKCAFTSYLIIPFPALSRESYLFTCSPFWWMDLVVAVLVLAILVCGRFGFSVWLFWSDLWPFWT